MGQASLMLECSISSFNLPRLTTVDLIPLRSLCYLFYRKKNCESFALRHSGRWLKYCLKETWSDML